MKMAKQASNQAYLLAKKKIVEEEYAKEQGIEVVDPIYSQCDVFEVQHHHLLNCLEKTTVMANNISFPIT